KLRTLVGAPPIRRDLIKRYHYLVPNSLVVSRGCPHHCDFCYKDAFYQGGKSFYTQPVDAALAEMERLPGKHLYFLDDHLFGHAAFAAELFAGMKGMGRVWQAAATVQSILKPGLLEKAVDVGLRSLFVGFETLDPQNLRSQHKYHNLNRDYNRAIQRLRDQGVMVNASFVYGMDSDDETVFDRTVAWAINQGVETATFHILTPYPGTNLYRDMAAANRITHDNWDLYDTRHAVYQPAQMSVTTLERGYWQSYQDFYRWSAIWQAAQTKDHWRGQLRHLAYTGAWKKAEPIWDALIRLKGVNRILPLLEQTLNRFESGQQPPNKTPNKTKSAAPQTPPLLRHRSSPIGRANVESNS
ncbi:MAG: B12-binding domain-containing radical SAM protein, partial [Spirulinaceae cyanobacterium]